MRTRPTGPTAQGVLLVRWAAVSATVVLTAPRLAAGDLGYLVAVGAVVAYAVVRTRWPIATPIGRRSTVLIGLEATATAVLALATGGFSSPFALCLVPPVAVAGLRSGVVSAVVVATATSVAVATPAMVRPGDAEAGRLAAQLGLELILVGVLCGYLRRILVEAADRSHTTMTELHRLEDANQLLVRLHQVSQHLPVSLDLTQVCASIVDQVRGVLGPDQVVILQEDAGGTWRVAHRWGGRGPERYHDTTLPTPVLSAITADRTVVVHDLGAVGGGLGAESTSGVYRALRTRHELIGVLVVEADAPVFGADDGARIDPIAEAAAVGLDNARWFARLRDLGAEQERMRIARDLHDRVGQSLATMAVETDRIARRAARDQPVADDLATLRDRTSAVVDEIRETLFDLHADLDGDVAGLLERFAARVTARSGIAVTSSTHLAAPVPPVVARELWRITQEAIVNAERHSDAERITVTWRADDEGVAVEVADDGCGVGATDARDDSFGVLGMRARADAIGARLRIGSAPAGGTIVRVQVARTPTRTELLSPAEPDPASGRTTSPTPA